MPWNSCRTLCTGVFAFSLMSLFGCEEGATGASLVGIWEGPDGEEEFVFEPSGVFRVRMVMTDGVKHLSGRYRFEATPKKSRLPKLETCIGGERCDTGGIWSTEYVARLSEEELILHPDDEPTSVFEKTYRRRR